LKLGLLLIVLVVLQVAAYADAPMVTINGHTMVSLRTFHHQFGMVTDYDAATNTYSVSRNNRTVYLIPYSTTAWIDDNQVDLKVPPILVDNHLYVPVRFMCHTFDLDCTWDTAFSQVVIMDGFTHEQVIWLRDDGWAGRPHIWRHPITYRFVPKFPSPPRRFFQGRPSTNGHKPVIGNHSPTVGNHPPAISNHPPTVGNHPPTIGNHPPTIGNHPPTIGNHAPEVGNHPPTVGNHPPVTGSHAPPTSPRKSSRDDTSNTRDDTKDKHGNMDDVSHGR